MKTTKEDDLLKDESLEDFLPWIDDKKEDNKTNIRCFNEKPIPNGIPWRFYRMW